MRLFNPLDLEGLQRYLIEVRAMAAVITVIPIVEVALYSLGIFVWLRSQLNPYSVAIALALAMTTSLAMLSFLLQVAFLVRIPELSWGMELLVLGLLFRLNRHQWHRVWDIGQAIKTLWQDMPLSVGILAIASTYLFLQAVLLPPSSWDAMTYHLPRVLLWAQNHSLFLRNFIITPQAAFPVGSDILFHLFLRLRTDYGLGLFSWLSYAILICSTYGLARPRVSRRIACTSTLVVASLPEVVYQATGTKNDIILAAVALACVVWADRALRFPAIVPLIGLGLTLCFGVSVKTSFVLFAFFFMLLWGVLVVQSGKFWTLGRFLVQHWQSVLLALLPALVLSQIWLFWDNYQQFGDWLGPARFAINSRNNDGLFGAVANVVRYSFQSIHLLQPVNDGWQALSGWSLTAGLQLLYDTLFDPMLGEAGRSIIGSERPFEIQWQPQEDTSWFGPLSIVVIVPAIAWCTARGKELARVMAIVAICLVLAISYKVGWSPWKSRFFSVVFASGGLCVAVLLQRFEAKPWLLRGLRLLSICILCYACLYNVQKPLIPSQTFLVKQNIWPLSRWTQDRLIYDRLRAGNRVDQFNQMVPSDQSVAILGYDHYFPFMFHSQNLEFVMLLTEKTGAQTLSLGVVENHLLEANIDYVLCLELSCELDTVEVQPQRLLQATPGGQSFEIYKLSAG